VAHIVSYVGPSSWSYSYSNVLLLFL
jgi:hypothetical protein